MKKNYLILCSLSFLCLGFSTSLKFGSVINSLPTNSIQIEGKKVFERKSRFYNLSSYTVEPTYDVVETPNGTEVPVIIFDELSSSTIQLYDSQTNEDFPDALMLRSSSRLYNCHSYAWYSQDITNHFWMNDPSSYYEDLSYIETTSPEIGDIVCYFDDNGTSSYSDDINLHSGIITGINDEEPDDCFSNLNTFVVTSKWGQCGLYRHDGDYCPYIMDGSTSYVKYYKRHSFHSYTLNFERFDYTKHYATCECGQVSKLSHVVAANSSGTMYKTCLLCGGQVRVGIIHYSRSNVKYSLNGSYILPNGVIVLVEEDIDKYFNGELIFE